MSDLETLNILLSSLYFVTSFSKLPLGDKTWIHLLTTICESYLQVEQLEQTKFTY